MGRFLLILLVALPPLAIALNHDIISAILIIGWATIVIPVLMLRALDFFRSSDDSRFAWVKSAVRVPIALLGLLSSAIGVFIVLWCLYNVLVQQLPEYSGPTDAVGLWLSRFGIAPILLSFGWYLLRLSVSCAKGTNDENSALSSRIDGK